MRTVFLGILLVLCIIRPTFSQSSNNPSVEFAGFGGDGEIILKDSKFDVFLKRFIIIVAHLVIC